MPASAWSFFLDINGINVPATICAKGSNHEELCIMGNDFLSLLECVKFEDYVKGEMLIIPRRFGGWVGSRSKGGE
jgi:hypothetical protein